MALEQIIDVQISQEIAGLTRVGFGTLAFVYDQPTAPTQDRVTSFGSADEVSAASFLSATAKAALSAAFSGDVRPTLVKAIYRRQDAGNEETYTEALDAAVAFDPDFYCVTIESRLAAEISEVAAWVQARTKLFVAATADANVLTGVGDVATTLLSASHSRTALIYSSVAAAQWPDTAWAGGRLPFDPGSITWSFKAVPGTPTDKLTVAQIAILEASRVTRLETIQGLPLAIGGFTSSAGTFVDIIRGLDWLSQRMAEDIFALLASTPKIPQTNGGIARVEGVMRARLQDAIGRNIIAEDENLTVTSPDISAISSVDRANRLLPDMRFTARLAGAVHKVIVRGVVTV